jgi:hypothetical protein
MTTDFSDRLRKAVSTLSVGAFLAVVDRAGTCLTLHVREGIDLATAREYALEGLRAADLDIEVKLVAHNVRRVAEPKSIEYWLEVFASGVVVFDPTLVAYRAQTMLRAARACRQELGKHIGGIYFDPKLRTMQVVIPAAASPADVRDFQREVVDIVRGTTAKGGENAWPFTIRVTAKTPRGDVTPVDAASVSFYRGLARLVRRSMAPGAIALAITGAALPAAAKAPANAPMGNAATAATAEVAGKYGILYGLSVFADGQTLGDNFAATGMATYFGDGRSQPGLIVRVAQSGGRIIVRDISVSDADAGAAGPAGPGS